MEVNIIVIDWSKGSNTIYTSAVGNAVKCGEYLANILTWFEKQGVSYKDMHLLGHSLGAHIVGIAGRTMSKKLPIITGNYL